MLMLRVVRPVETTLLYLKSWENCPTCRRHRVRCFDGVGRGSSRHKSFTRDPSNIRYWPLADIFFYTAVSAFGRKADVFALTCPEEQAHCAGPGKKGRSM